MKTNLASLGNKTGVETEGRIPKAQRGDAEQGMITGEMKGSEKKPSLAPGSAYGFQDRPALQGSLWGKQGRKLQLLTQGAKQLWTEGHP